MCLCVVACPSRSRAAPGHHPYHRRQTRLVLPPLCPPWPEERSVSSPRLPPPASSRRHLSPATHPLVPLAVLMKKKKAIVLDRPRTSSPNVLAPPNARLVVAPKTNPVPSCRNIHKCCSMLMLCPPRARTSPKPVYIQVRLGDPRTARQNSSGRPIGQKCVVVNQSPRLLPESQMSRRQIQRGGRKMCARKTTMLMPGRRLL